MRSVTINSYYPRAVLNSLEKRGFDLGEVLYLTRIPERILLEPEVRISTSEYAVLFRYARKRLKDEAFGYLPQPMRPGTFALACELMVHASDIEGSLRKFCQFCYVAVHGMTVDLAINENDAVFSVELAEPERDEWHYVVDSVLSMAHRVPAWLSGQRMLLKRAAFTYPAPLHVEEYHFLFPCEREFSHTGKSHIVIDLKSLKLPIVRRPREMKQFILGSPLNFLGMSVSNHTMVNRVYNELSCEDYFNMPGCHKVARQFNMSEQTLRRKLKAEGTSFQEIKDHLRRDVAIYQLSKPSRTVSEISDHLGFSTPGAFSRAFKHWMGVSPEEYRNRF